MAQQADFFALLTVDEAVEELAALAKPRRKVRAKGPAKTGPDVAYDAHHEAYACELEATGRYRVLRKLQPRTVVPRALELGEKLAVIVDTETTGLDHAKDEVIELGMVAFTYREDGAIGDVIDTFSALREPSVPISATITKLTGITSEMVAGHAIDLDAVARFMAPASLVIAHNARFDRPFCEHLAEGFDGKAWACSVAEVPWGDFGFEGVKLGYLIGQCGMFHNGHRAVDDCHALLEVLAAPLKEAPGTAFARLLETARRPRHRVWAESSPFEMKDALKARGYRWNDGSDGRPKSWWREVEDEALEAEISFLQQEIYLRDVEPYVQKMTAFDRYKA
ncbi:3'-5' exonuclease [Azorhizobium doebereinerae]|uniref:3'-5' exonuclease n=1 Tax=Azorhizobium doebereinerae TaxID=281091 RepID=UPI00041F1DB1|nr:3'-5' exonuclease [Azorhizobium doebereinerae]